MKQFFIDLWFGEPVRVFGILSTASMAYIGYGTPPAWFVPAALVVNALAGFYGFRALTTPAHTEKLSENQP